VWRDTSSRRAIDFHALVNSSEGSGQSLLFQGGDYKIQGAMQNISACILGGVEGKITMLPERRPVQEPYHLAELAKKVSTVLGSHSTDTTDVGQTKGKPQQSPFAKPPHESRLQRKIYHQASEAEM